MTEKQKKQKTAGNHMKMFLDKFLATRKMGYNEANEKLLKLTIQMWEHTTQGQINQELFQGVVLTTIKQEYWNRHHQEKENISDK